MKIKQDFITLLREVLVTQMNHWTFFSLYVVFAVIMSDLTGAGTPNTWLWLAMGSIPFLLFLIRTRIKKFWLLSVLHLAVASVMFFVPAEYVTLKVFHVLTGIIYVVISCCLWAKGKDKKDPKVYPLLPVVLSLLMMYMLHYQAHYEWDSALLTCMTVVLGIYFIVYYVEQYQNFLVVNSSSAGHIPAKEMFRSGMGLACGYTGIGFLILFLISNIDWLGTVLNVLKNIVSFIIRAIQALFPPKEGDVLEEPELAEEMDMMGGMEGVASGDGFWLWQVLEYVVIIILIIFAIFALIKGVITLVKFIQSKLRSVNTDKSKDVEESVSDVREKCDIIRNDDWKLTIPFLSMNPKDRIRNMYKKRILLSKSIFPQGNESGMLERYTARETGKILEREELAIIYEKARYSNKECSSEDVKRMKNACR